MRSSFQTIVIIIFSVAFVAAVAVFSGLFSSNPNKGSSTPQGNVLVWGILPAQLFQPYVTDFNANGVGYSLIYEEHSPESFSNDLVTALANGRQPDIVILSSELFSQFQDKLAPIPYTSLSERAYRDTHIDGAQIFLTKEGASAVPLLVDPLVVYYNKDILAAAHFALPPRTWTEVSRSVPLFTRRDARNNITQTTVALGEAQNISHFRDILSAFFLQSGNAIVSTDTETNTHSAVLTSGTVSGTSTSPAAAVLNFYTSFSNPTSVVYSWNRALPGSLSMFLSGKSAFYIGRASELFTIQAQNPNLNFDVTELFQPDNVVRPITFGSFIAASALKSAPNFTAAYTFLAYLSGTPLAIDDLSKRFSLPPTRRDLLLVQPPNPYVSVFFKAALSSFAWPDPNPTATENTFRAMIGDVTSGRSDADSAINEANRTLQSNIR